MPLKILLQGSGSRAESQQAEGWDRLSPGVGGQCEKHSENLSQNK
jgi:hypothetical protein